MNTTNQKTPKKLLKTITIETFNIKRAHASDNVNAFSVNNMKNKKQKQNTTAPSAANNNNYFSPLQTIDDEELEEDEVIVEKTLKVHIPPITILKCKIEEVHGFCKASNIADYAIRKISIGLKLFLKTKADYDTICNVLTDKYEFFSYATKDEKPYKAILFGLDKHDPAIIKKKLCEKGLQCLDVKIVIKKNLQNSEYVFYVVYFKRQTISMNELRKNYSVIDYIRVRWEFQQANKKQITQCYNCQMFGHGSSRCKVKTFCANCAGPHKTSDCKESTLKCANCNGNHKSTSEQCPSKTSYLNIRLQHAPRRKVRVNTEYRSPANYNNSFPNTLRQSEPTTPNNWVARNDIHHSSSYNSNTFTGSNDLFSPEEIKCLTLELITNLRNCKNKADQFEVITNLACKFLS